MYRKVEFWVILTAVLGVIGYAAADFVMTDSIAGYVHRNGAGSRVDVRSDGTHDGAGWTVVLTRNLQTGDADHDIQFEPEGTYSFQVATWDNSGDEAHDMSEMATIYSMEIPAAPGPVVFSGTPGIFEELTGEYLASGEVQITVRWADETKNDQRRRWVFDGTDWSQSSSSEDRVAFIWDLQEDEFASAGTCMMMCHPPTGMYTAEGTFVDTWHWKATRTNPSGYADDKYWDDGAVGTGSGRHSDPGQAPYMDNVGGSPPTYMAEGDPGVNANFIFEFQEGVMEAGAFANGAWSAGAFLPGYVGRRGSGSRVDTRATAAYDGSGWTVTFRRKLDTGDAATDITFEKGGTYSFQVAKWDNAGDEAHDISDSANVYSMMVPTEPGAVTFSATPNIFTSLSGNLLSSDEIEITASWSDATRSDLRKQWSFDGTVWLQSSSNEDRVAFIWDMQEDGFSSAGTCLTMCHPPTGMYTAAGTFVDTWHWKATRTGTTGFCDDKFWDDGSEGTASGRREDPGTSVYKDNSDNGGVPTFMSSHGAGASAKFLFDHTPAAGWARAVTFDDGGGPGLPGPCVPGPTTMCLNGGRFQVEVAWVDFDDNTGPGHVLPVSSDTSGLFYFFREHNWEMLIKVLDGCNVNEHYWVFFAATTNVGFTVTVTDTDTGEVKVYTNPLGHPADAVTDTRAFATCP